MDRYINRKVWAGALVGSILLIAMGVMGWHTTRAARNAEELVRRGIWMAEVEKYEETMADALEAAKRRIEALEADVERLEKRIDALKVKAPR